MTKYYCAYCDVYLTHDAPRVRKDHNAGWKHAAQVRAHFLAQNQDRMTRAIGEIVKDYEERGMPVFVPPPITIGRPGLGGGPSGIMRPPPPPHMSMPMNMSLRPPFSNMPNNPNLPPHPFNPNMPLPPFHPPHLPNNFVPPAGFPFPPPPLPPNFRPFPPPPPGMFPFPNPSMMMMAPPPSTTHSTHISSQSSVNSSTSNLSTAADNNVNNNHDKK